MGPAAPRTRGFGGVAEVQYSDGVGPAVLGTQVLLANAPTSPPPPQQGHSLPCPLPFRGWGGLVPARVEAVRNPHPFLHTEHDASRPLPECTLAGDAGALPCAGDVLGVNRGTGDQRNR